MKTLLIGLAALPLLTGVASAADLLSNTQMDRVTAGAFEVPTITINCPGCVSASSGQTSSTTNGTTTVTTSGGNPTSSNGGSTSTGSGSNSGGGSTSTGGGPPAPPTVADLLGGHIQSVPGAPSVATLFVPKF
ncbi:MAG TPA: hypothetical protein VJ770_21740 [Stellaceae bacterium]|nr:hypothetical protein [Stellaceae bacterium]